LIKNIITEYDDIKSLKYKYNIISMDYKFILKEINDYPLVIINTIECLKLKIVDAWIDNKTDTYTFLKNKLSKK